MESGGKNRKEKMDLFTIMPVNMCARDVDFVIIFVFPSHITCFVEVESPGRLIKIC